VPENITATLKDAGTMSQSSSLSLKHIQSLRTKKGRKLLGRFMVEGIRSLEEAHRHGVLPVQLVCAPAVLRERGADLRSRFAQQGVDTVDISAKQLTRIGDTRTSQGLLGVFTIPDYSLSQLCTENVRTVLVCENIADPGNLGTLLRSAAAFGFRVVALVGRCVDIYSPKVVRSAAGAEFAVKAANVSIAQLAETARKGNYRLVAADARGGSGPEVLRISGEVERLMLAIGSESDGLSQELLEASHTIVHIEHEPAVESLNAAVAGSLLMSRVYERTKI
jgi:TrmH family RNA methyltransferase